MKLHRLTDRCLRHVHVDAVLPGADESFADPPEFVAKLRGRASVIAIGWAVADGGRACVRYDSARSGTPAEDQTERMALYALGGLVEGA